MKSSNIWLRKGWLVMNYIQVLKNRNFNLLWIGQLGSRLGDWICNIAMLVFISDLRFTGLAISGLLIVKVLPFIIIGPFAGNYIDGKKRKNVMIYSDLIRMILTLSIIGLVLLSKEKLLSVNLILFLFYLISILNAIVGRFFDPARTALMPQLVAKDELKIANSMFSMSNSVTLILGPAIGGILVSILGVTGVLLVNAATFLFSAACVALINIQEKPEKADKKHEGLKDRYLKGMKILKTDALSLYYVYSTAIRTLVMGLMNISFLFVAARIFSIGKEGIGWLYSSLGVGVVIGSFIIGIMKTKIKDQYLYLAVILLHPLFAIFYINADKPYLACTMLLLIGFCDAFHMVIFNSTLQKNFAQENLGKVYASSNALMMSGQLISMGIGGLFFDLIDYRVVLNYIAVFVIVMLLIIYYLAYYRRIGDVEKSESA